MELFGGRSALLGLADQKWDQNSGRDIARLDLWTRASERKRGMRFEGLAFQLKGLPDAPTEQKIERSINVLTV